MDAEDGVEVVSVHLSERSAANDAGVVDEDVDPAPEIGRAHV